MAHIRTVPPSEATGTLLEQYRAAVGRTGKVYEIVALHGLMPDCLDASMRLYQASTTSPRAPLPRWLRETIATVVSRTNDCFY